MGRGKERGKVEKLGLYWTDNALETADSQTGQSENKEAAHCAPDKHKQEERPDKRLRTIAPKNPHVWQPSHALLWSIN